MGIQKRFALLGRMTATQRRLYVFMESADWITHDTVEKNGIKGSASTLSKLIKAGIPIEKQRTGKTIRFRLAERV